MLPQVLFISQNSRTRRVYHELTQNITCEPNSARAIADALVQIILTPPDLIILDGALPIFEVSMFLEVLQKKPSLKRIPLFVFGLMERRHLFPADTRFIETNDDFVRCLQDFCSTV
ncbi:MAG: hypothetical protein A2804_02165 [Candidatus Pacebacteria bacterium RIFCSPHIGHO2_01_FULL_46_10]|nr:MAG: hypothetical protein A2804_02165 [Candidatus Pacebacteria bacterium RIFCSPHIGHO2_01_FULL_46_10]